MSGMDIGNPRDCEGAACAACGDVATLRIDHIEELSSASSDLSLNVELLCARCSVDKNARSSNEWIAALAHRFAGDEEEQGANERARPERCKVFCAIDSIDLPLGWPASIDGEVLWAQRLEARSARILNTPFALRPLALLDVVHLRETSIPEGVMDPEAPDHYFECDAVAERSGIGTLRLTFDEAALGIADDVLMETSGFARSRESSAGACAIALEQRALHGMANALQGIVFPGFRVHRLSTSH